MTPSIRPRGTATLLALALAGCAGPGAPATWVMTLGTDTVGAELVRFGSGAIEGRQLRSWPIPTNIRYRAELGTDGSVSRWEVHAAATTFDSTPSLRATIDLDGRHLVLQTWRDGRVDTTRITTDADPIPMLYPSVVTHLLLARRFVASGGDSAEFDLVDPATSPPMRAHVRREAQGLLRERWPAWGTWNYALRLEGNDDLTSVDSDSTTERYRMARAEGLDLERVWASFAERQRAIGRPRRLSPLDTVEAALGAARVTVEYSRPSRRGRVIFGGLVPWGEVWRTGAAYTTHLVTTAPVTIGGRVLPAGKHSLWTLPTPDGVTLILNRQTDTWSTDYDARLDLFRVPMTRAQLAAPVDTFTVSLVPDPAGLRLRLEWERERWEAALTPGTE